MDVLVTESIGGAARTATEQLERAGHRVHRCSEDSSEPFPCAGLVSDCPLDANSIDLVLTVHSDAQERPSAGELGVTCGLRRRIPIAVAGPPTAAPFTQFGAEPIGEDLVGECERIAGSRRPGHEAAALEVARIALGAGGFPTVPSEVSVERQNGRLRVRVFVTAEVPARAREIVAVRVVGRLRAFDPYAAGIDIGVATIGTGS